MILRRSLPSLAVVILAAGDGSDGLFVPSLTTRNPANARVGCGPLAFASSSYGTLPVSGTKAVVLKRLVLDDDDGDALGGAAPPTDAADEDTTQASSAPRHHAGVASSTEVDDISAEAPRDYNQLTVVKLKIVCKERGLPVSGKKVVLLERVKKFDEERAADEGSRDQKTEDTPPSSDDADVQGVVAIGGLEDLFEENLFAGDDDLDLDDVGFDDSLGALTEQLAEIEDALFGRNAGSAGRSGTATVPDDDAPSGKSPPPPSRGSKNRSPTSSSAESRRLWFLARDVERLVKANDPHAAPVAEELLDAMTAAYERTGDDEFRPTERSYTLLINAHAKSGTPTAARDAEAVLRRMQTDDDDVLPVRPNAFTYTAVIDAYARSREEGAAERAEEILYEMMDRAGWDERCAPTFKTGDAVLNAWARRGTAEGAERAQLLLERIGRLERVQKGTAEELAAAVAAGKEGGMRLTTSSFATVITGWARSGVPGGVAAKKAEEVLDSLIVLYKKTKDEGRKEELRPNTVIFNAVIDAWGKSRDSIAGVKSEALLIRMQEMADEDNNLDCEPDEFSYNSCINSHANSGSRNAAKFAEGVLKRMQDSGKIPPNTISYNSVLNAWSKSKLPGAAGRAEQILLYMIDVHTNSGSGHVKPTVYSFSSVLNSRAKSKEPGKARRAQAILHRLKEVYEKTGAMDDDFRPNSYCYNGVLNACAFSADFENDEKKGALEVAVQTLNEMQKSGYASPDSITYGNMLKCLANLMPPGEARNRMGARIFDGCRGDGLVGEMVLNEILRVVPGRVFDTLVGGAVKRRRGARLTTRDLPKEWTRNVRESGRYINKVRPPRKKGDRPGRPRTGRKKGEGDDDKEVPLRPGMRIVESSWDSSRDV